MTQFLQSACSEALMSRAQLSCKLNYIVGTLPGPNAGSVDERSTVNAGQTERIPRTYCRPGTNRLKNVSILRLHARDDPKRRSESVGK
jgi:hypothetical protein